MTAGDLRMACLILNSRLEIYTSIISVSRRVDRTMGGLSRLYFHGSVEKKVIFSSCLWWPELFLWPPTTPLSQSSITKKNTDNMLTV